MKYFLLVVCAFAAVQAETDVRATLEQVQKAFEDMGKTVSQNINTEEMKETMIKKFEEMQQQMQDVSGNVEKYMKEHPDSPVAQARTKMEELINEFKAKNPEVEANLKNFQQSASEAGEKFAQQMKEAYEKMNAEGGLKDQVTQAMNDMGEKMKQTASDMESKIKEMIQQAQH